MRKRCYCGNSERGRVSERGLFAATRTRPRDALQVQLKFRRDGRNFSPPFCSSLHQVSEYRGGGRERRDCAFDSAFFRGIFREGLLWSNVLRGLKPCSVVRARPMSWEGKLFLSIFSPLSFSLSLSRSLSLSPSPTPPTNKRRECHSPKKTSRRIRNFFGPPQAPLPFLSILASLFVPLLGDETAKFYMVRRQRGHTKMVVIVQEPLSTEFRRGDAKRNKNPLEGPASRSTSAFLRPPLTTVFGGGKEEEEEEEEGLRGRSIGAERAEEEAD